ncbi:hypothetical protein DFR30_0265 [Thiogranum longum]|uniref:Zn-dependent protease with chaperone function n=1 Tax=Thiogranum longum TaxID=1537524 RepID=A0A4R1HA62_9GAMM|nr:hypothetical protein [Thiogranum longum]TCK17045.1 hypothetical protein DFR30_0265 [Thiogranum longum]
MHYQALNNSPHHVSHSFGLRAKRVLDRNPALRLAVLGLLNGAASLMLLSPAITLSSASLSAIWLYNHINGPLDWFFTEALCALALVSGWVAIQQYLTRPRQSEGVHLEEQDCPELFSMLERRTSHFDTPAPDLVILTDEARLSIRQVPHTVIPFGHKSILAIGAPLLFFLSRDLFRLALAGAVAAHARKQHGLRGWIIRRCEDWPQVIEALQNRPSLFARLFLPVLQRLDSLNHLLGQEMRAELQQDAGQWVAEHTDEQQAEQLLAAQILTGLFLQRQYWPMVMKAADRCPSPVVKPFSHFELLLGKTLNRDTANRWLLQAQTSNNDNREVRDMLAGLRLERLTWSGLPETPAINGLVPGNVLKALDRAWQIRIQSEWDEHHARFQHDLKRFNQLRQQHAEQVLHGEPAMRYVELAEQLVDMDELAEICQSVCESNRNDPALNFSCGRRLIESGRARTGCQALQRAAELDQSLAHRAHAMINEQNCAWLNKPPEEHKAQA